MGIPYYFREIRLKLLISLFIATLSLGAFSKEWQCRNTDLEIACINKKCTHNSSFTPINIELDKANVITICVYSVCWKGLAKTLKKHPFLTITAEKLKRQGGTMANDSRELALLIDPSDMIGVLKFESFAQPMTCTTK